MVPGLAIGTTWDFPYVGPRRGPSGRYPPELGFTPVGSVGSAWLRSSIVSPHFMESATFLWSLAAYRALAHVVSCGRRVGRPRLLGLFTEGELRPGREDSWAGSVCSVPVSGGPVC